MSSTLMLLSAVAGLAVLSDAQRRQSRVVRAALRHADLPLDKAAHYTGTDVRQLAREIDGETGTLRRLWLLPDSFKAWLGVTLIREYGVPEEVATVAQVIERKRA